MATNATDSPTYEVRSAPGVADGGRALTVNGQRLVGYAIVYNAPSRPIPGNGGSFIEIIKPGAARKAVNKPGVCCLQEHRPELILGKTPNTLRLWEDEVGLGFEVQVPDTSVGRDLMVSVERGDIGGCSFRFPQPVGDAVTWKKGKDGQLYRYVHELDLVEVTLTVAPAYPATLLEVAREETPAAREYRESMARIKRIEKDLADDECARNMAKISAEKKELAAVAASPAAVRRKDKGKDLQHAANVSNPTKPARKFPTPNSGNGTDVKPGSQVTTKPASQQYKKGK